MRRFRLKNSGAALAAAVAMTAFAPSAGAQELNLATLTVGGSFHAVGSGIAKVVGESTDLVVTVKPFGTTGSWIPLLDRNQIQLGLASTEESAWAYRGTEHYPARVTSIRLLAMGNRVQSAPLVVREDSGIEKIEDLKGKRVYWVGGNVVTQYNVQVMLESVGLSVDDIVKVPVSSTRAGADLLRENRLDATYGASATTPYAVELDQAVGIRALSYGNLDPDAGDTIADEMHEKVGAILPGGRLAVQPAGEGYYDRSAVIVDYGLQLVGNAELSDDAAYEVVKTIWEKHEELGNIYVWLKRWTPETLFTEDPVIPYHPGAVRFYKEVGVWTDAAEAKQSELLAVE